MSWPRVLRRHHCPETCSAGGRPCSRRRSTSGSGLRWSRRAATGTWPSMSGRPSPSRHSVPRSWRRCAAPALAVAAHRIATYKPLVGPLRLDVADTADGLRVACQWPPGQQPPTLLATSELVFWVALARIATRHHVRPVDVTVPALPRDPASLEGFFGARVRTDGTHAVTLSDQAAGRQLPHPPAAAARGRHHLSGRPGEHPGGPGHALPPPGHSAHRRDRLPARLRRHQLVLPGLPQLDRHNPETLRAATAS